MILPPLFNHFSLGFITFFTTLNFETLFLGRTNLLKKKRFCQREAILPMSIFFYKMFGNGREYPTHPFCIYKKKKTL